MVVEVETEPTFNPGTPIGAFDVADYPFIGASRHYDMAPDGERFLMRTEGETAETEVDPFTGLIFVENWFEELTERVPFP